MASDLRALDAATGGALIRAQESQELRGKLYEQLVTPVTSGWRSARIAFIGAGNGPGSRSSGCGESPPRRPLLSARERRVQRFAWLNRGDTSNPESGAGGNRRYRPLGLQRRPLQERGARRSANRSGADRRRSGAIVRPKLEAAINRGRILGESSNIARELSNEPSNVLTPTTFAERATEICEAAGVAVEMLDEARRSPTSGWDCCSASRAAAPSRRA